MISNRIIASLMFCLLTMTSVRAQLTGQVDSVSYSAGLIVAKNLKAQGMDVLNPDMFLQAVLHVINEEETLMKPSDAEEYFRNYQQYKLAVKATMNKKLGEEFLAENAKREEVVTTESGLQYEVVTMGDGAKPDSTDTVYVHYHGTLMDGTVFDSSVERDEPIEFPLNRVIPGWTEALQLMPVGSKFITYIPSDLAYGERGAGGVIPPNATLIFEIELLEIR